MFVARLSEVEDQYWPLALNDFYGRYSSMALPKNVLALPSSIPDKMPYALGVARVVRYACETSNTYEPVFAQITLALERGGSCELPAWFTPKYGKDSMKYALATIERSVKGCINLLWEIALVRSVSQGYGPHNMHFAVGVLLGEEY
jgi:hypothetical protein